MPTYFARKAGNINAPDVWATAPGGTASDLFPTFTNADVLMSNSFAITVNVSTTVADVRNDTTGGATIGGTFTLSNNVTLTANMIQSQVTGGATIVSYGGSFPNSASIVGNATSVNTSGNANVIQFTGSGTLNFTGNVTGDATGAGTSNGTINVSGGGTLNFTGNATGGSSSLGPGINVPSGTAIVNVTGNCFGGTGSAPGVRNRSATGTININGIAAGSPVTGSGPGALNDSTGAIFLKRARGNAYGPGSSGLGSGVGASNASTGFIEVEEIEFGTNGQSPVSGGGIRLKKMGTNVAVFNFCDTAGAKILVDATQGQMPAEENVRSGVSYASGALTGTCAVPEANSVAWGVPIRNTTGTAVLKMDSVVNDIWAVPTSALTTAGSVGQRLANCSTVATTGDQIANLT